MSTLNDTHSGAARMPADDFEDDTPGIDLAELLQPVRRHWRTIMAAPIVFAALGFAGSFLLAPQYLSLTTFLPPQQQQSGAASALASLGALSGLAGGAGIKSPVDQYISLMESETVTNRLIDRFSLMKVYDLRYRESTRKKLLSRSTILAGKKDGLISVMVRDEDPHRAADIANQYVEELRHVTATLAVSEAQQRRMFFENQLQDAKTKLIAAQSALQQSGFTLGALRIDPQSAGNGYAHLRADLATAQVRLETLRGTLADAAPEVRQQLATVAALQSQVHELESTVTPNSDNPDYVGKYREFKYEETLFDLMAKQYEIARVDESREGALIQVVDPAHPAERRASPRRLIIAAVCGLAGMLLCALVFMYRERPSTRHRVLAA